MILSKKKMEGSSPPPTEKRGREEPALHSLFRETSMLTPL